MSQNATDLADAVSRVRAGGGDGLEQPARADSGAAFRLLGRFTVRWDGHPARIEGRRVQELLSYLLLFQDRPHNREVLADTLWGEAAATQSRKYLRQALWQLRRLVKASYGRPSLLVADAEWIQVDPAFSLWLDTAELESAVIRTSDVPGEEIDNARFGALTRVTDLYRGDLLVGWYHDWCVYERERLKTVYLAGLEKLLAYCEAHGRVEEGLGYGRVILSQDHAHERTHRRMMRLRWLAGDRTGAIRQFQACRSYLRTELGIEPAHSTLTLYDHVRRDRHPSPSQSEPRTSQSALPSPALSERPDLASPPLDPEDAGALHLTLGEIRQTLARSLSTLDSLIQAPMFRDPVSTVERNAPPRG